MKPDNLDELIGVKELAKLLDKAESTIRTDVTRRPASLPPRFQPPGTRKARWVRRVVLDWLNAPENNRPAGTGGR